ncbi:calcium-binding protein [Anaerosporomusa subterranea]
MGEGITQDLVEFNFNAAQNSNAQCWEDITIKLKNSGEILTLRNWFMGDAYQVDKIRFADGSEITA